MLNIIDDEKPEGVIVQFGGQTPLNLAAVWKRRRADPRHQSPDSIDAAEDRERFAQAAAQAATLPAPNAAPPRSAPRGARGRRKIGYPVMVRPSYVLGGRAMEIVHDAGATSSACTRAAREEAGQGDPPDA